MNHGGNRNSLLSLLFSQLPPTSAHAAKGRNFTLLDKLACVTEPIADCLLEFDRLRWQTPVSNSLSLLLSYPLNNSSSSSNNKLSQSVFQVIMVLETGLWLTQKVQMSTALIKMDVIIDVYQY